MPNKFKPEEVARHRATYKKILHDCRAFVHTTMLENFTPALYRSHITYIIDRLGDELTYLAEEAQCQPPPKPSSTSS